MSSFKVVLTIILIMSLVILGASAFSLGKEYQNQESPAYKTASTFAIVSSVTTVVSIILLMISIYRRTCPSPEMMAGVSRGFPQV